MLAAGCWRGRTPVGVVVLVTVLAGACAERATSATTGLPERAPIATTTHDGRLDHDLRGPHDDGAPTPADHHVHHPPPPRPGGLRPRRGCPTPRSGPVVAAPPGRPTSRRSASTSRPATAPRSRRPLASAVPWFTMESRDRDTAARGAADIVVEPGREIRAPVTGTVIRAGTYTLYCDHVDQYAVIEPDARPGWEVKVLHIEGLAVSTRPARRGRRHAARRAARGCCRSRRRWRSTRGCRRGPTSTSRWSTRPSPIAPPAPAVPRSVSRFCADGAQ